METIAVYWEPKPKTYGFRMVPDSALLKIVIQPEQMAEWGLRLLKLSDLEIGFRLVLAQHAEGNVWLHILLESFWAKQAVFFLGRQIEPGFEKDFSLISPVGLISFQGPHFGDRYGIADAAFQSLDRHKIPFLAAACSGATVYIVLPQNMLHEAQAALTEAFTVP